LHLYTCVHSIFIIFTFLHLFPISFLLTLVPISLDRICSALLFSNFVKEKNWHFCLYKIAKQGVPLWHFQVHMYYSPNWLISSIFFLSILLSFLWWF
jgi:hypothetical protein